MNTHDILVCDWTQIEAETQYAISLNTSVVFKHDNLDTCLKVAHLMEKSFGAGVEASVDHMQKARHVFKRDYPFMYDERELYVVTPEMQKKKSTT